MQQQTQIVHLTAPTVQHRIRIHPAVHDFFRAKGNKLLQKVLTDYFLNNVSRDELIKFIEPYENIHNISLGED